MNGEAETPSYYWQAPGKLVSVRLGLHIVDRLASEIENGFESTDGRPDEIGGLLLGRTRRNRDMTLVEVEDFAPVECEHAIGPSYLLSATDRKTLEERIRWHKRSRSIVGFFRSHTRREFAATVEDVDLMSAYFPESSKVLLLIHALRDQALSAGFLIWEGRSIRSTRPYVDFPFDTAALRTQSYEPVLPKVVLEDVLPALRPPAEVPAASRSFHLIPRPEAPVQVATRQQATEPAITPGRPPAPQRIALPATSLRQPWTFAWLATAIILLALIVSGTRREPPHAAASVRPPAPAATQPAVSPAADDRPSPFDQAPAAQPPAPEQVPELAVTVPLPPETPPPSKAAESADRRTEVAAPPPPSASAPAVAPAVLAAAPARRSPPPESTARFEIASLPDPPEIVEAPRPGVAMPSTAAAPPAPPATGSSVSKPADSSVSVEVASAAQPRGGVLKLFSKRHRFVAPVPIRESQPALPRELRSHLTRETVDVKVYVDRTGKVDYAEVMSDGATSDLASFAIFSSRRWQFSPARVGDETVASEVVLRFRFNP